MGLQEPRRPRTFWDGDRNALLLETIKVVEYHDNPRSAHCAAIRTAHTRTERLENKTHLPKDGSLTTLILHTHHSSVRLHNKGEMAIEPRLRPFRDADSATPGWGRTFH